MSNSKIKKEPLDDASDLVKTLSPNLDTLKTANGRRTWSRWLFGLILRAAVWYTVAQALIFCPSASDQITREHSQVCKPYLRGKAYIAPHLTPYYDVYAAPYVEKARPLANRLHQQVYQPSRTFANKIYAQHGAPVVASAQSGIEKQWEQSVRPQFDMAISRAASQYDLSIKPFVDQATDVVGPYYTSSRDFAGHHYEKTLLPTYEKSLPHIQNAYRQADTFTRRVVIPRLLWINGQLTRFISRKVLPTIYILYGENVQPQLIKIRERLANYRGSKRLESMVEEDIATSKGSSLAAETTSVIEPTSMVEHVKSTISASFGSITESTPSAVTATPTAKLAAKEELKIWRERFAKAANRGTEDLRERVLEIATRQRTEQIESAGEAFLVKLQEASEIAIESLKSEMIHAVESFGEDAGESDISQAHESVKSSIRKAGQRVKAAAQDIRAWKAKFLQDTNTLVSEASETTLEVLDGIRDLGLQDLGIKWAEREDVAYKDWTEYHKLRKTFDEWRHKVQDVSTSSAELLECKERAEDVEARGMAIAEDTAGELIRLRDVAGWKIAKRDSTDDFSTRDLPAVAAKAAEDLVSKASQGIFGSSARPSESGIVASASSALDDVTEAIGDATAGVDEAANRARETIVDGSADVETVTSTSTVMERSGTLTSTLEEEQIVTSTVYPRSDLPPVEGTVVAASIASQALSGVSSAVDAASSHAAAAVSEVVAPEVSSISRSIASHTEQTNQNLPSAASRSVEDAVSQVEKSSSSVKSAVQSVSAQASESYSRAAVSIEPAVESVSSRASSIVNEVPTSATSSDADHSTSLSSMADDAASAVASASSIASSAIHDHAEL